MSKIQHRNNHARTHACSHTFLRLPLILSLLPVCFQSHTYATGNVTVGYCPTPSWVPRVSQRKEKKRLLSVPPLLLPLVISQGMLWLCPDSELSAGWSTYGTKKKSAVLTGKKKHNADLCGRRMRVFLMQCQLAGSSLTFSPARHAQKRLCLSGR